MEFNVYRKDGTDSGEKFILENFAFDIEPNDHAIYLAVRTEMTNSRRGTHSTKTRSEVRGGGRKPWRQKGRGTARAGSIRSPLWVGGGVVFGPKPQKYSMKINKRVKNLARKSALAYKFREGAIRVIEDFIYDTPRAKNIRSLLKGMGVDESRVSLFSSKIDKNLILSCRNFYNVNLVNAEVVSTYDILNCDTVLIDKDGLEKLNARFLASN
jgi:large subunit ribosomal protein L4